MAATTFIGHFLGPDTHSNRPATSGLPDGTMYVCTTHAKIERVASGAWVDYATLGSGVTPTTIANDTLWDAKGDLVAASAADTAARLPVGTNGQVLSADSTQTLGVKWTSLASGGMAADTIWDAKGDLAVGSAADTAAKLTVGSNGQVLTADSAQTLGVKWAAAAAPSGGLTKLFDSTLGTAAASIDTGAGGIAGGSAVLEIYLYARSAETASLSTACLMRVNNDSGSNYDLQRLRGLSGTASAAVQLTQTGWEVVMPASNAVANVYASVHMTIPNYDGTVGWKASTWVEGFQDSASDGLVVARSGNWRSTAAITRIAAVNPLGNFTVGSRLTVFGLN